MTLPPAAQALVEVAKQRHMQGRHVDYIDVIEHPNYGPRVKMVCRLCPHAETYVRLDGEDLGNG